MPAPSLSRCKPRVLFVLVGVASLSEVAPADTHRCTNLCTRVAGCNVPIFWGMRACLEYCASGNYERTFGCLESATKTGCHVERIEACIDPCD